MASYERAKAALFLQCERAVVWIDDEAGRRIAGGLEIPVMTVGTRQDADLRVGEVQLAFGGSRFSLRDPGRSVELEVPLSGRFNVANAAVAAACGRSLGIDDDAVAGGLASVDRVPGRFELVATGGDFTVAVDYAHTPDGIEAVIGAAAEILAGSGRVIAVVGAGGDRTGEAPPHGNAACRADVAILTMDNPVVSGRGRPRWSRPGRMGRAR